MRGGLNNQVEESGRGSVGVGGQTYEPPIML